MKKKRGARDPLEVFVAAHRRSLPRDRRVTRFNAGEHVWLGGRGAALACSAFAASGAPDFSEHFRSIARRDGRDRMDYGELVALSGDFYPSPSALFEEKPAAVPWLYEGNDLSDLREIFAGELRWIEERQRGAAGTTYPDENVRLAWNAKSYVELALKNVDHFGWHNVRAYCRHHAKALSLARAAKGMDETFRRALYTNAFADHFLTDAFAAGHIRVPREEIRAWARGQGWSEKLAGALSKVLHDNDGHVASLHGGALEETRAGDDGLRVTNAQGSVWYTRCDGQLFLDRGSTASMAVHQAVGAVQASVTELLAAWHLGEVPEGTYTATAFAPFPHPDAPALVEKFPADMPAGALDALFASVAWYAKVPWIGPGLERRHLGALFTALPHLLAEFRASVRREAEADPALTARIAPAYVRAFERLDERAPAAETRRPSSRRAAAPARAGIAKGARRGSRDATPVAVPPARPRLSARELDALLARFAIDRARHPLVVVGVRGYYEKTLGDPARNDRGIYDDALFISSPSAMVAFNGNVDPSRFRAGHGTGAQKGMASLKAGAWFVHQFDEHKGQYLALCQRAGPVTVLRDGADGPYEDTGWFGINVHRGGLYGTSSEGCQTVHPGQWESFISLAVDQAQRYHGDGWRKAVIPYVLLEDA